MITKKDALEIAKKECEKNGWLWMKPFKVYWGFFHYTVCNSRRGASIRIKINKKSGKVVNSGFIPY